MTYEIPQQLEYKEKIIFGLNFEQLIYALIFFPVAIAIFFRGPGSYYLRGALVLPILIIASGFMFFNFKKWIKNLYLYLKMRKPTYDKIKKLINIDDIKDDCIIQKKKKIAILKVEPLNFSIKSKKEQEMITYAFRKFVNSIDYPIQILMNTEPLDLNEYLDRLDHRMGEKFEKQFKSYKGFLLNTISTGKIMNRKFYIAIKEHGNLQIQLDIIKNRLANLNIKTKRLTTKEIFDLLQRFYESEFKNVDLKECEFSKISNKKYLQDANIKNSLKKEYIYPNSFENKNNFVKINNKYNRIITASGYPRSVEPGFLDKIVITEGDFDFSIHIQPYPIETMMLNLNRELQKQRADLYAAQVNNTLNPTLEIQYTDTRNVLENLQKGNDKLFFVSLYINCRADSLEELKLLTKRVEAELNSILIVPKIPRFQMMQGLQSLAPSANDQLKVKRNVTSTALSAFFPFTSQFLKVDEKGILFGLNKTRIPIIRDIFSLSNPNGTILASSGSGKSYLAKLLISRHLMNNTKVMVIDPQGEYKDLVESFNGQLIKISRKSKTIINPLDLMGHDYAEKRLALIDLIQVMIGDLSEPQKAIIDKALSITYKKKGINNDETTWLNEPPIMQDLLDVLVSMEKKAFSLEKPSIQSIANRVGMYVDGVFSFLNQQTQLEFNNDFVCFDIGNMPKQVKPVIMFLVLDYVYMKMKKDINRKVLIVDEAWSLLSRTKDANYIFEIVKTCRKFNLGLVLINQEVEGLLNSQAGKSVLANSAYTILMRQKPAVIDSVKHVFHLSDHEVNHLLTSGVGEGIVILEDDHSELRVISSSEEHKLITTNADERLAMKEDGKPEKKQLQRKVNITLDPEKGFYKKDELNDDEKKFLLDRRYVNTKQYSLFSNSREKYLLKPRYNESSQHFFLIKEIEKYIREFTDKVELYETAKPDIVFEVNGEKYAVEVETGKVLKSNKKRIIEKVELLKQEYGDKWFFVVTDRNIVSMYNEFGKTYSKRNVITAIRHLFVGKSP